MSELRDVYVSDTEDDSGFKTRSSNVYLAFIDTPVKETDTLTIEDTFIGGDPIWMHPDSLPDSSLLACGACKRNDHMKLLAQIFSPLDREQVEQVQAQNVVNNMRFVDSNDDRVLYVFVCTKCQRKDNSVRCIRGIKKHSTHSGDVVDKKIEDTPLGKKFDINPFDLSNSKDSSFESNPFESANTTANPFDSGAPPIDETNQYTINPKNKIKNERKLHDSQKDKQYDKQKSFKSYLLYVEQEMFQRKPDHLKLPKNLKIDQNALELAGESVNSLENDPVKLDPRTEKLSKFLDDETFQKFQEVVGYNPHQVLRYEFGGKPLLYAESKVDLTEKVANPGYNPSSKRVFEVQLMPKMILDLEEDVSLTDGMEWGTIMIFCDIANFIPSYDSHGVGYVEEVVKVQWEIRD